ncbi:Sterol O-acyltransferase 2 (Sterol-ester synthase 2) [Dipsacomyces acuminosporus]|nr:Sterol O-acyltransferase 2 (Sterol-ester synthase 2) [Dipsacomyces acuminosporus]
MTRSELEATQAEGRLPPVFTPSLHRSLRNSCEADAARSHGQQQQLHHRHPASRDADGDNRSHGRNSDMPKTERGRGSPAIFFRPQTSILDYTELMYQGSDRIRGLVTCFWTIVGAYLVSMLFSHYESSGEYLSLSLGSVIFSRAKDLIMSDLALVLSTFFVVPFVRCLWVGTWQPKWLDPRSPRALVFQAVAEVGWLLCWYLWQGTRGWPWAQRCFFALHTVVNWMKIHSYLSTNRSLAVKLRTHEKLTKAAKDGEGGASAGNAISALDADLCPYAVRFPSNLTVANYCMFQLCPALVYELEYPRTERIRWGYVAEKLAGTAGIFAVFYVVVAHLVIPHLERMPETGILVATLHLMGPMGTCWLLFFFITFDSIANGFAELTRFADRRFYDDWWNACGLDEFSRKWNRPVHMFLARHIYMPVRENWKASGASLATNGVFRKMCKTVPASVAAMAATFLFSSILHELTIVVACNRWNHGLFFCLQMMQIPIIMYSDKIPWLREQQALRNWAFWVAMTVFQPFLLCMYTYKAFANRVIIPDAPL